VSGQRQPGPGLAVSLVVLGIGLVVGVVGVVETVVPFVRTLTRSTPYPTPADIHAHLSKGTYEVYELTSRHSGFSPVEPGTTDIDPRDVSVVSASGSHLLVTGEGANETITRGDDVYTGAVQFAVPAAGVYEVSVHSGSPTRVIVARSLGGIFRSVVGWFVTALAGGLVFVVGVVLLIVGLVRRRRRPVGYADVRYAGAAGLPPPNWYPDPTDASQRRYWDGRQWTDQTYRS
jgi:hypothetical protein